MSAAAHAPRPGARQRRRTAEVVLGPHWYAKQGITVVDVRDDRHRGIDPARYVIDVAAHGDLESCYLSGDNGALVPSGTLAALVLDRAGHLVAERRDLGDLGASVAAEAGRRYPQLAPVHVRVHRHPLSLVRRTADSSVHVADQADSVEVWTSPVRAGDALQAEAGIEDLGVVLAGHHAFADFVVDDLCPDTPHRWRVLVGELSAWWSSRPGGDPPAPSGQVRHEILGELARSSASVQELLASVASAVIRRPLGIGRLTLELRSHPTAVLPRLADETLPVVQVHPGPVATTSVAVDRPEHDRRRPRSVRGDPTTVSAPRPATVATNGRHAPQEEH